MKIKVTEKIADKETIKYLIGSKCDLTAQRAIKAETALVKLKYLIKIRKKSKNKIL